MQKAIFCTPCYFTLIVFSQIAVGVESLELAVPCPGGERKKSICGTTVWCSGGGMDMGQLCKKDKSLSISTAHMHIILPAIHLLVKGA